MTFGPGAVTGKAYALSWQGEGIVDIANGADPTLKATVTAKGLDGAMKSLAAAPPDSAGKSLLYIGALRGLAQIGPDGLAV